MHPKECIQIDRKASSRERRRAFPRVCDEKGGVHAMKRILRVFYIAVIGMIVFTGALMIFRGVKEGRAPGGSMRAVTESDNEGRAL